MEFMDRLIDFPRSRNRVAGTRRPAFRRTLCQRFGMSLFVVWALAMCLSTVHGADTNLTNANLNFPSDEGDFNPGLGIMAFFIMLVLLVGCLFVLGFGLVVGIVICALAGGLTAVGLLSTSTAIAFVRRSPASGFRALVLQMGALAGVPCGIAAAWVVSWLAHAEWSVLTRILVGGAGGLICGILVGCAFNFVWGKIAAWILLREDAKAPVKDA